MIQKETNFVVADNSGAKEVRCIHVVGSTGTRFAYVGDLIRCAVKRVVPGGKVKKKQIVTAVVVRARKELRRQNGEYIRFGDNAVVLVESVDNPEPVGTRVLGPVARELRKGMKEEPFGKILSLAAEVW